MRTAVFGTLLCLLAFAALPVQSSSSFAETKKETQKSILERKAAKTFTVKDGEMKVMARNHGSCKLEIKDKEGTYFIDVKDWFPSEEIIEFKCYAGLIYPEKGLIAILGSYKTKTETLNGVVLLDAGGSKLVKLALIQPVSIKKLDAEKFGIIDTEGAVWSFSIEGKLVPKETVPINSEQSAQK